MTRIKGEHTHQSQEPGWKLGDRLCAALGVDSRDVIHVSIDAPAADYGRVYVTRVIREPEAKELTRICETYSLHLIE